MRTSYSTGEKEMILTRAKLRKLVEKAVRKELIKEHGREQFTGGSVNIEPYSGEEQEAHSAAYYELFDFLQTSNLPGDKPSEQLMAALRWIAKFEQEPEV